MVAKFHESRNIVKSLMYNEKKVEIGLAECIHAGNLVINAKNLDIHMKKNFLKLWSSLNVNIQVNCVHISLSFHPQDREILNLALATISAKFMDEIGFGNQPYLVYQHKDTSIPHVHIVSTNVQDNGKQMETFYICKHKIMPTLKKLEREFGLTPYAHEKNKPHQYQAPTQSLNYGDRPTKKSIEEVILFMIDNYSFTNFEEWNSLLKIFNIKSTQLAVNEKRSKPGIIYSVINPTTNKAVGVPIQAGKLAGRPTFNTLAALYQRNSINQERLSARIIIELTLLSVHGKLTKNNLIDELTTRGIDIILRQHTSDQPEIVTYIDHHNKCAVEECKLPEEIQIKNLIFHKEEQLEIRQPKKKRTMKHSLH